MNVLDTAIYTKLTTDTGAGGVNTLATGGIHQLVAPQGSGFPRVHFQALVDTGVYALQTLSFDRCYYQFTAFAVDGNTDGVTTAGSLVERIRTLLTDASMSVSGKILLYSRFERSLPPGAKWDEIKSRYIYAKGMILEVWLA